jgi:tetratricopeptide (TPR) repeat protein
MIAGLRCPRRVRVLLRSLVPVGAPALLGAAVVAFLACAGPADAPAAPASTSVSAGGTAADLMPWHTSGTFETALAKAKNEKKLVFVDFYATWCGPCKMMDRQTYTDSSVAVSAARFVNRKYDAEKGEGLTLARKYAVTAYPTLLVVDAEGKEVNREMGYRPPDRFVRFLEDTRNGRTSIPALEARIAGGEDSHENRAALGELYAKRGDLDQAREQVDRALALAPDDPTGRAGDLQLFVAATARSSGNPAAAATDAQRFLERFPKSPRRVEALGLLAASQADQGQGAEALGTFRQVLVEQPGNPQLLMTYARFAAALGLDLEAATDSAKRAVTLTGGGTNALDALAEVYGARGMWQDAVDTIQKALDAKPGDAYLKGRLERFQESAALKEPPKSPAPAAPVPPAGGGAGGGGK